jgi:excisionase family DNA binding protein
MPGEAARGAWASTPAATSCCRRVPIPDTRGSMSSCTPPRPGCFRRASRLAVVPRILRRSTPELTAEIYGHLDLADLKAGLRRLTLEEIPGPLRGPAPVLRVIEGGKAEGPKAAAFGRNLGAFRESGRSDSNRRPLAPQSRPHHESSDARSGKSLQSGEVSGEAFSVPSPGFGDFRRSFHAPVMQENVTVGADWLLTVKEAARRLKVSTATVYALCEGGKLAYTGISTHSMRIFQGDLAAYVRSTRVRSGPA